MISSYFLNSKIKAFHFISDQIAKDLNFDDLFKYLDRTTSKIGQQYLYYKIRVIDGEKKLNEFSKLSFFYENNVEIRIKSQILLSTLNNNYNYDFEKLINEDVIRKPEYIKYLIPLSILSFISVVLGFNNPIFFLFLLPLFIINAILHYKTKSYINYYINAISQLNKSLKVGKELLKMIKQFSFFTDTSFINKINEIKFKTIFFSIEKKLNHDLMAFFWIFFELFKIQFNLESILFYSFIDDIVIKRKDIEKLFQMIGEIDTAISLASVKYNNNNICTPNFVDEKEMIIKNIIHPLIKDCVPNSIELKGNSLLLTGSNMSGKTTFIRTVAINSIFSQTLNIAFAEKFSIPYYKVFSSINVEDDLNNDKSYYLNEVLRIKRFIEESNNNTTCLFVLDEIFKGTNTVERISGGKAILSYLNKKNHFVFVSTHDIELTELLSDNNFDLYHFSEHIDSNQLFFDHKLKKGKLKSKNAIKILELYNFPTEIIKDAKKVEKVYFNSN